MNKFVIAVYVENKFGVLTRVTSMFTRRGFNIDALTVGETECPEYSRITISLSGDGYAREQLINQLRKLINVKKVEVLREDCIKREALEETGLTLIRPKYRGIVTFISDGMDQTEFMHLFTATEFTGTLKECDEGTLEWIPKEDVAKLPHWDGDLIFLALLERGEPFFSLKLTYKGNSLTQALLNDEPVILESFLKHFCK